MKIIRGIGASSGYAFGPSYVYAPQTPQVEERHSGDVAAELVRLKSALARVDASLAELEIQTEAKVGKDEAEVFAAHRLFLVDPAFSGEVEKIIQEKNVNAEWAVQRVMTDLHATFESMDNEYFRARATDVLDVGMQIIRALLGLASADLTTLTAPVIVIADELTPSDTARMDKSLILGLVTARGGKSAHAAILARGLGIPAVVGAGQEILAIPAGVTLILDGSEGLIIVEADEQTLHEYRSRQEKFQARLSSALAQALQPAITTDGVQVEVVGNIGAVEDAARVIEHGGEGVGLLRTEFLFLDRVTAPTEEEQVSAYVQISQGLKNRPLIIRTLDVGGDKPLPYIPMPREDNPFLGNRGIRLCLTMPDLFKTQLRAILRAAHEHDIKIMFPMVSTMEEIRAGKKLLDEVREELTQEGKAFGDPQVGIMVEVPAAAASADLLASEVDFFSIGTNDLTQYTLAADRTNPSVQAIANHFHPAVLRLIRQTIEHAHAHDVWVGLCGELAGEPLAAPLLLGMGLDEFSMAPASIPLVKEVLRRWSKENAKALVHETLQQVDAQAVIAYLEAKSKT